MKGIERECKVHGLCPHVMDTKGSYRCRKCRVDAVTRKRRRLKQRAVDYLGGQCKRCDYKKCIDALEFHHRDPSQKDFGICDGNTRSWKRIKQELKKMRTTLC